MTLTKKEAACVQDVVVQAGVLRNVAPGVAAALTGQLEQVAFPRRHTIFAEGQPGSDLYIVLSGKVKIGRTTQHPRDDKP